MIKDQSEKTAAIVNFMREGVAPLMLAAKTAMNEYKVAQKHMARKKEIEALKEMSVWAQVKEQQDVCRLAVASIVRCLLTLPSCSSTGNAGS